MMEFRERIYALASRIEELKGHLATEEATKNALILPFFQLLGYDTFDPRVVVPEFTADMGTKKGEKVDYAIKRDGNPIILVEAKCCGVTLDQGKASQLLRYFHAIPSARIGILTDGVIYKFFSDLDQPNVMDQKPFMTFDFSNIEEALIPELRKLANERFDIEATLSAAQDLKHIRQLKARITEELTNPSDDFVRYFAREVYSGPVRANIVEDFRGKICLAFQHHVNDIINERLQSAMLGNAYTPQEAQSATIEHTAPQTGNDEVDTQEEKSSGIVTTQEEIEGYFAIKAILHSVVALDRIVLRDAKSYCAILLDDNNRKPVCRLHFNAKQKYLGIIDDDKKETRHPIDGVNDIYAFADQLKDVVAKFEG